MAAEEKGRESGKELTAESASRLHWREDEAVGGGAHRGTGQEAHAKDTVGTNGTRWPQARGAVSGHGKQGNDEYEAVVGSERVLRVSTKIC